MSDSIIVWFAVALLLFWAMGAYNRLMRLRSQGIAAFATLEALLNQYMAMVQTNLPETEVNDAHHDVQVHEIASAAAWAGLAAAVEQFNASLKVAHAHPLHGPTMRALRTAHDTLCLSWSRLRDLPADLTGPALPGTLQSQWEQVAAQVDVARTEFNRRVENYNEAIDQFPALVLAWLFGFKSAQPI